MSNEHDLAGKTFDQQMDITGGTIAGRDISPNRCIPGEIVFEPLLNGVRITARDSKHRVLWGFIGSKGMISQIHCPVAVYETLQELLGEELNKLGLPTRDTVAPMQGAIQALNTLQTTLDNLKASIDVKKVSDATLERARTIARVASDADKMLSLETSSFKGNK
jgi:hypothetical protein